MQQPLHRIQQAKLLDRLGLMVAAGVTSGEAFTHAVQKLIPTAAADNTQSVLKQFLDPDLFSLCTSQGDLAANMQRASIYAYASAK